MVNVTLHGKSPLGIGVVMVVTVIVLTMLRIIVHNMDMETIDNSTLTMKL